MNATQIGDVKKTDLPDEKALTTKQGKKEGDVMMVKNSITGNVDAYQWSSANNEWINVGQVVDAVGLGRKQLYEGKEYDYVFDVDVSEGMPPLKLPYNVTRKYWICSCLAGGDTNSPYIHVENPYEAAQQFLLKNDLPSSYVDEVVRFIEKSTGGATLGGPGGVDPYTGTSSYRSGGPTQSSAPSQGSFSGDPWSRSSSSAAATPSLLPHVSKEMQPQSEKKSNSRNLFSQKTPLTFTQANVAAIHKKLLDFNKQLSEQPVSIGVI